MIFTTFKRITRTGFVNFWRNGFLSFAAIVVITLSLCAFGGLIFAGVFGRSLIADVKDKVDINVYFTLNAPEPDILSLKKDIERLTEVKKVEYVSRDVALSQFKTKWQGNKLISRAVSSMSFNGQAINIEAIEKRELSADGKTLTITNTISSPRGVDVVKLVFARKG